MPRAVVLAVAILVALSPQADAQFRRGMMGSATAITLRPHQAPALLLPAGAIALEVRNETGAPSRLVATLHRALGRQLTDNDARLRLAADAAVVMTATIVHWGQQRRDTFIYVSEPRQNGTREVVGKDGKKTTEPIMEFGGNRPAVATTATGGVRLEVRRASGGGTLFEDTLSHTLNQTHEKGVATLPDALAIDDLLLDRVVSLVAGRVTPARVPVEVMLARSDEVDRHNALAQASRWTDWLAALGAVPPHRDLKRDAYRLHNLAVAHEAVAYESPLDQRAAQLARASTLITTAVAQNGTEKYIAESAARITASTVVTQRLAALSAAAGVSATPAASSNAPAPSAGGPAGPLTNQDVIDLRAAGLDDANLIAAIRDARAVAFDLSPAGLKALLGGKVSNGVITAMRARQTR